MKKTNFIPLILILMIVTVLSMTAIVSQAQSLSAAAESGGINIEAASAVLTDVSGNSVLYEKNADDKRPIASMVKIMALNVIFDEVNAGNLSLDEGITASENASSMGGSQAFLDAHNTYNAGELVKSIVVASANDSCVAMAERISFSVEGFVSRMNAKAAELGMTNTNFVNCTGLPAPNQYSTARDVSKMFARLIKNPKFFEYAGEWMYDFAHPSGRKTTLTNTNKLVRFYEGCDGGKTGFTNEAMSCLAATASRGGSRFISVVMGAADSKKRNAQVCKLFDYGFAGWEVRQHVHKGINLEQTFAVSKSKEKEITAAPADDYFRLIKRGDGAETGLNIVMNELSAPIAIGDVVGRVTVTKGAEELASIDLVATSAANALTYNDILGGIINNW